MPAKKSKRISRRDFLRSAAVGAAVFGVAPAVLIPRRIEAFEGGASVHPNIDCLRVVGIHDAAMTKDVLEKSTWVQQEKLLNSEAVANNLDKLASALADEKRSADAWKKIFIKPAAKSWSDTVVAIKVNFIAQQRTRSAVLQKICRVLVDDVGVKATNIFVYDGCHGAAMAQWKPANEPPAGVNLANQWGSYNIKTAVPAPWKDGKNQARCLNHLADGKVDILINIALCKGHGANFGRFTMSMKNHFGTFEPNPSHMPGGSADYLIGINKTPEILGELDPKSGKVLFPRQQLCITDSLWASDPGPGGDSTAQPNRLFMGTLPAVLDYQVATNFRKGVMGWSINEKVAQRFLTEFGYSPSDLPGGGKILEVSA